MAMLADTVDGVIGVDTHRDTLAAAAVTQVGGVLAQTTTSADAAGYQHRLGFARSRVPGRRGWRWKARAASAPAWPGSWPGSAAARGTRPGGRPAQAASIPHRRQERRVGRRPGRPGSPRPRAPGHPAPAGPAGGPAGAADHPTLRNPGPGGRHRPAQSPDRGRPRGVASRTPRPQHRQPGPLLRPPSGAAD
jgi:hypothetical protein